MATASEEGKDPDYRFSLANERTFLAWIRTALALLAGGILLHQFVTDVEPRWINAVASSGLAIVASILSWGAYRHWRMNEIAMRCNRPLPRSWLMPLLSVAIVGLAGATGTYLLWMK
jgi:putative membrane protein